MFKKIAIGLLALTVLGAGGAAMVYNVTTVESVSAAEEALVQGQSQGQGNNAQGQQDEVQQSNGQGNQEMAAEGSLG